jgi:hypothetical protein
VLEVKQGKRKIPFQDPCRTDGRVPPLALRLEQPEATYGCSHARHFVVAISCHWKPDVVTCEVANLIISFPPQ